MTELLPGTKIPSKLLTHEAEALYITRAINLLKRSRLNSHYPDARALMSHIQALAPNIHQGLYPGVEMHARSGLPTYKEWTRVQTDVLLAPDQLRQLGDRSTLAEKATRQPDGIFAKQLKKIDYYTALHNRPLATLGDMRVALRRVDTTQNKAWFNVVLDKLDVSGLFVRYTIDLSQQSSAWNKPVVTLDKETAQHTQAFQSLIYKFTSLDAEFTYVKLASIQGLEIERVIKGVIGPFYIDHTIIPQTLQPLFKAPDHHLGMFSVDMIAHDIPEDRQNDPLESFFSEKLSPDAQAGYQRARAQMGYKRFKDRKFVAHRAMLPALRQFCEQHNTRNIIYPS